MEIQLEDILLAETQNEYDIYFSQALQFRYQLRKFMLHNFTLKNQQEFNTELAWMKFYSPAKDSFYYYNLQNQQTTQFLSNKTQFLIDKY
jgi:hypothetical protein